MNKFIVGIVILAVLIGGAYYVLLVPKAPTAAILYIDRGNVEVDIGGGWQKATDEMELSQSDKVRTTDGEATIVLLEGEVMRLSANTEVELEEISSDEIDIIQLTGETWNKVTKISGITGYTVSTPNTVATVRGTEFIITDDELKVKEGEVDYYRKDNPDKKITVGAEEKATADLEKEDFTEADFAPFDERKQEYINTLKRVRWREIQKHQGILKAAKKQGYGEEEIKQLIIDVDEGREDLDTLYEEVPAVLKPKAEHTYKLTKEILHAQST